MFLQFDLNSLWINELSTEVDILIILIPKVYINGNIAVITTHDAFIYVFNVNLICL